MIVALLSWWDETPARLTRCVVPLARFCDHLVAVDGAYQAMPGAELSPRSPGPQADAVVAGCDGAGLGVTLHRPAAPWYGDEVAKRSFMFKAAGLVCEPGDWLFVIDADEIVREVPADVHDRLAGDVATVEITDGVGSSLARRFFRWDPSLRVEGAHCVYVTDTRVLWGPGEEACGHVAGFRLEHQHVEGERRARQLAYYERRDRYGLETTARVPEGASGHYAFEPREGSCDFAMVVSLYEFALIVARGYGLLNGVRAAIVDSDPESGFIRFRLAEPYQAPVTA